MLLRRVSFIVALVAFAPFATSGAAAAESYATHAIQLIVPFDPGSSTDVVARSMQPTLGSRLGQSIVVINKAGASGTIGSAAVAASKPDGYTVGILGMGGTVMVPHFRKLSYDLDSFDLVCQIYSAPVVVMVSPKSQFKDINALLEYGKANPDKIFYGSPGIGTPDHLNTATFFRLAGVKATHVPFSGGGAVVTAILSEQITVVANTTVTLNAHRLRPLAVLAPQRLADYPEVPTAREIGVPFEASIWAVLAAPKGLAQPVRTTLEEACSEMLKDPNYRGIAERAGFPPYYRAGDELKSFVKSEYDRYGKFIRDEGIDMQ
jgi:tripartite-type tricarboxylate transporter receptor subunit TctC